MLPSCFSFSSRERDKNPNNMIRKSVALKFNDLEVLGCQLKSEIIVLTTILMQEHYHINIQIDLFIRCKKAQH